MTRNNEFLDFQYSRIRFALYQAYSYRHTEVTLEKGEVKRESDKVAWTEVAASINEFTGLDATRIQNRRFGERLRAFVVGNVSQEMGDVVRTKPRRIDDIIAYLLAEEAFLTKDEFEQFAPDHLAAVRVMEFLDSAYMQRSEPQRKRPAQCFVAYQLKRDVLNVQSLYLQFDDIWGFYVVRNTGWRFDCTGGASPEIIGELTEKLTTSIQHELTAPEDYKFSGWGLDAFDGNMVIFLRDQAMQENKFLLSIVKGETGTNRELPGQLAFYENYAPLMQFPGKIELGIDNGKQDLDEIREGLGQSISQNNVQIFVEVADRQEVINSIIRDVRAEYARRAAEDGIIPDRPRMMFMDDDGKYTNDEEADISGDVHSKYEFSSKDRIAAFLGISDPRLLLREIFQCARSNLIQHIDQVLDLGFPVNFQDPKNQFTLIHYAAAGNATDVAEVILAEEGFNPLLKDNRNRYASDVAFEIAGAPNLARILQEFERSYALANDIPYKQAGIDAPPRPM